MLEDVCGVMLDSKSKSEKRTCSLQVQVLSPAHLDDIAACRPSGQQDGLKGGPAAGDRSWRSRPSGYWDGRQAHCGRSSEPTSQHRILPCMLPC